MKSAAPSESATPRSVVTVTTITGMAASSGSDLSAVRTDQPSIFGIMMSSVIKSGLIRRASVIAVSPASASATRRPSLRRTAVRSLLADASSSTINTNGA